MKVFKVSALFVLISESSVSSLSIVVDSDKTAKIPTLLYSAVISLLSEIFNKILFFYVYDFLFSSLL